MTSMSFMMSVSLLVWRRNKAAVLTTPTEGIKKDMDCGPWGIGQANLREKKRKIRRKEKKRKKKKLVLLTNWATSSVY